MVKEPASVSDTVLRRKKHICTAPHKVPQHRKHVVVVGYCFSDAPLRKQGRQVCGVKLAADESAQAYWTHGGDCFMTESVSPGKHDSMRGWMQPHEWRQSQTNAATI